MAHLFREPPQKIKKHKIIISKILNLDCVFLCGVYRIQKKYMAEYTTIQLLINYDNPLCI